MSTQSERLLMAYDFAHCMQFQLSHVCTMHTLHIRRLANMYITHLHDAHERIFQLI